MTAILIKPLTCLLKAAKQFWILQTPHQKNATSSFKTTATAALLELVQAAAELPLSKFFRLIYPITSSYAGAHQCARMFKNLLAFAFGLVLGLALRFLFDFVPHFALALRLRLPQVLLLSYQACF